MSHIISTHFEYHISIIEHFPYSIILNNQFFVVASYDIILLFETFCKRKLNMTQNSMQLGNSYLQVRMYNFTIFCKLTKIYGHSTPLWRWLVWVFDLRHDIIIIHIVVKLLHHNIWEVPKNLLSQHKLYALFTWYLFFDIYL